MKALVVYDSLYGNTEEIARAMGAAITGEVRVLRVGEVDPSELNAVDLFFIGSPTQAGRPTTAIQDFLNKIPEPAIKDINVATFDTRIPIRLVGIFGYAAEKIADSLRRKGALILASEGFFVRGKEDSLKEGELERATSWAKEIVPRKKNV